MQISLRIPSRQYWKSRNQLPQRKRLHELEATDTIFSTTTIWKEYMRRYWVKNQFIDPYHPNKNPVERDMAYDYINIMIYSKIDPHGWFKVIQHTSDLPNHNANQNNTGRISPITFQTGDARDITLLIEFKVNDDILYLD